MRSVRLRWPRTQHGVCGIRVPSTQEPKLQLMTDSASVARPVVARHQGPNPNHRPRRPRHPAFDGRHAARWAARYAVPSGSVSCQSGPQANSDGLHPRPEQPLKSHRFGREWAWGMGRSRRRSLACIESPIPFPEIESLAPATMPHAAENRAHRRNRGLVRRGHFFLPAACAPSSSCNKCVLLALVERSGILQTDLRGSPPDDPAPAFAATLCNAPTEQARRADGNHPDRRGRSRHC